MALFDVDIEGLNKVKEDLNTLILDTATCVSSIHKWVDDFNCLKECSLPDMYKPPMSVKGLCNITVEAFIADRTIIDAVENEAHKRLIHGLHNVDACCESVGYAVDGVLQHLQQVKQELDVLLQLRNVINENLKRTKNTEEDVCTLIHSSLWGVHDREPRDKAREDFGVIINTRNERYYPQLYVGLTEDDYKQLLNTMDAEVIIKLMRHYKFTKSQIVTVLTYKQKYSEAFAIRLYDLIESEK